jgi:parvulin-like peptidyl-prolyl isomerase
MKIWLTCALWMMLVVPLLAAETVDRIVAIVNGRPVMESELAEQLRFEQLLAARPAELAPAAEQHAALGRLVDQVLLQQQMDAAKFEEASADELNKRMQYLRQQLAPKKGEWEQMLARYGLTESDVSDHVALQLRTLRFIDARFRPAVRIDPHAVETYYREQLLPKMKAAGGEPIPLKEAQARIQEILMQQQMDELLENWLKVLRSQTELRLPGPSSAAVAMPPTANAQAGEMR